MVEDKLDVLLGCSSLIGNMLVVSSVGLGDMNGAVDSVIEEGEFSSMENLMVVEKA